MIKILRFLRFGDLEQVQFLWIKNNIFLVAVKCQCPYYPANNESLKIGYFIITFSFLFYLILLSLKEKEDLNKWTSNTSIFNLCQNVDRYNPT